METERIAQGLIARTLPKVEWTHHAHMRAGLWHVLQYPPEVALDLMRGRIRAYNEATGVANTANSGYHETITRFYLQIIRNYVHSIDATRPLDDLAQELIARYGERDLPLRYYSRQNLFSADARRSWSAPDLQPLAGVEG